MYPLKILNNFLEVYFILLVKCLAIVMKWAIAQKETNISEARIKIEWEYCSGGQAVFI